MSSSPSASEMSEFNALKLEREKASYSSIKTYLYRAAMTAMFDTSFLTAIETSMGINRKELVIRALEEVAIQFRNSEIRSEADDI